MEYFNCILEFEYKITYQQCFNLHIVILLSSVTNGHFADSHTNKVQLTST